MKLQELTLYQSEILTSVRAIVQENIIDRTRNYIVGVSGINCAGKSTLAQTLGQDKMGFAHRPIIFDIDDFLLPRRIRDANPDQVAGCYNSFDYQTLFEELLLPASQNTLVKKRIRVFREEAESWDTITVRGPCVVIVEGIFLFRRDLPDVFDIKFWLNIDYEEVIKRAIRRKREINKHPTKNSILKRYHERFIPAQKYHIEVDNPKKNCNFIINILN